MIKNLWKAVVGSVKWVLWIISVALIVNVMLLGALVVTPVMFYFFFRARSATAVIDDLIARISDKVAEEVEKHGFNMHNDVEFNMEIDEDEDNLF